MAINKTESDQIRKIARAAALELTPELMSEHANDYGKITELFAAMDKIEVCPTKQTDFNKQNYHQLRPDNSSPGIEKENGTTYRYYNEKSGYFTVPKVLNTES